LSQNDINPRKNFEEFWNFFEYNYAFFDIKGIDWKKQYSKYSLQITDSTSDKELYKIMTDMVAPLKDGHVTIKDNEGNVFSISKKSQFKKEFNSKQLIDSLWTITNFTLLSNECYGIREMGPKDEETGSLFHYSKSDKYGYLKVNKCFTLLEDLYDKEKVKKGIVEVNECLDTLMQYFESCDGLIIDFRSNPGGYDKYSYLVANRFVEDTLLGHYKCLRDSAGGYNIYKDFQNYYLEPVKNYSFLKPKVILTNDQTASAADVFALITKNIDNTTSIGDNTEGIFSDMKFRSLSNGWKVSLSDECYFSSDSICYEGQGVPVDIKIQNTKQDLTNKEDPVITRAISELSKK
jgi:hypothetical protein